MDQDVTKELVIKSAVERDGKLAMGCVRAFEIHRRHGIPLREIGRICNENGIKISGCQLGCFP